MLSFVRSKLAASGRARERERKKERKRKIDLEERACFSLVQLFFRLSKHHSIPKARKVINNSCSNVIGICDDLKKNVRDGERGNSLIVHFDALTFFFFRMTAMIEMN